MAPTLAKPFHRPGWVYEERYDGWRMVAPTLTLAAAVCVFDKNLVSQFHVLDRGASDELCTPPVFMAFDCLHVHGLDVRGLPLHRRRYMLEQEVAGASMIFTVRRLPDSGLAPGRS